MTTVFTAFKEVPYTFLEITRGTVYGNRIKSETELMGVFKLRSSDGQMQNIENWQSSATLHAHPEDYKAYSTADLVGQGVRVDGIDYQITSVTDGRNFSTGVTEHLTFTLERAELVENSDAN